MKGMLVYFIFLNANRFEKSATGNIQNDCSRLVFVTCISKLELYKECSFEKDSENSFERM
jgi:hypothetical protein